MNPVPPDIEPGTVIRKVELETIDFEARLAVVFTNMIKNDFTVKQPTAIIIKYKISGMLIRMIK